MLLKSSLTLPTSYHADTHNSNCSPVSNPNSNYPHIKANLGQTNELNKVLIANINKNHDNTANIFGKVRKIRECGIRNIIYYIGKSRVIYWIIGIITNADAYNYNILITHHPFKLNCKGIAL